MRTLQQRGATLWFVCLCVCCLSLASAAPGCMYPKQERSHCRFAKLLSVVPCLIADADISCSDGNDVSGFEAVRRGVGQPQPGQPRFVTKTKGPKKPSIESGSKQSVLTELLNSQRYEPSKVSIAITNDSRVVELSCITSGRLLQNFSFWKAYSNCASRDGQLSSRPLAF